MKQIDLREGARRQHRTVALFAVIQCWIRSLDGVCFQRDHLERLVGVERFKGTRIDWLRRDLKDAFPYQQLLIFRGTSKFASYYVSRVEFPPHVFDGKEMQDEDRIKKIEAAGLKIGIFALWPAPHTWEEERLKDGFEAFLPVLAGAANYDERLMVSYLGLLFQGQLSPRELIESIKTTEEDNE
jgi:hypothetical protein